MSILVTGAAGFIGSSLVDRLLEEGHEVVGLDNFDDFYPRARKSANLSKAAGNARFRLAELDLRDRPGLDKLVAELKPIAVAHLAARAGVRPSIQQPALYADVNVTGTTNLLQACCGLGSKPSFVFASSSSVYGERTEVPFRETDAVDHPVSPYAATKKACELIAHAFHHLHGMPVTALRFFTAYGPRNRPDLAIFKFAQLIEQGKPIPMFGDGSSRRDYTYIDDIVDGIVRAIDRCQGYNLYNLGNSSPVMLREMIDTLAKALGKAPRIERLAEQPGDVGQTYADIARASKELGYSPNLPFSEGIARFVEWFRREIVQT